jgi:lantibiotic modifying enzyme
MSSDVFLDAAAAIGRGIVADAIWHDGCCSWMGALVEPEDPSRPEYRPVGAAVYDGTAGIGLFLAQLFAVTADEAVRRTALGALRHAVARAGEDDGFQAGTPGIAWAAGEAGALLDAEEPAAAGAALARAWARREPPVARCPDVVLGAAGALAALLAVGEREAAIATGNGLLESATVTRHGWSWRGLSRRRDNHLCGAAHGAGGIGWALVELYAATGEARFAAAASGAFDYERSWLDAATGTWPDLRVPSRRGAHTPGMTATWCYGEAGTALSRLRAREVLGDGPHCPDADIAVETTRRHVVDRLPFAIDDLSLCHGSAGAADVLLGAGHRDVATAVGEAALQRFGGGDWPCGVLGTTPGLFRGLSGIGWFFLRLHEPSIASPLALARAPE